MNCTTYMVNCNFVIHATCPLPLMTYKYSELQVSFVIQKLSCKASCKTPFFSYVRFLTMNYVMGYLLLLLTFGFNYFEISNNNNKLIFLVFENFQRINNFHEKPIKDLMV